MKQISNKKLTKQNCSELEIASAESSVAIVMGGSMKPFLKPGQRVVISKAQIDELYPGAIVAFKPGPNLHSRVHRIKSVFEKSGQKLFLIQGDNQRFADGVFDFSCIEGKVTGIVYGKYSRGISIIEELLALKTAGVLFKCRLLFRETISLLMPTLLPFLTLKTISFDSSGNTCNMLFWKSLKVCSIKKYSEKNMELWVHPWFSRTNVAESIGKQYNES